MEVRRFHGQALKVNRLTSIIIPSYNRAKVIPRALESVKEQKYRPIEILLIDDGSDDDSERITEDWGAGNTDESLSLRYTWKENGGPSSCRNIGIEQSVGDYVYFLDSDDYMHPNLLSDAVESLEKNGADCVLFGFDTENASGERGTWLPPTQPGLKSFFENRLWGYTSSSLKRADLIRKIGIWNEETNIAEDYEFLGRALLHSEKTVVLQGALLTVSRGGDSLNSRKDSKEGLEQRLIAEQKFAQEIKLFRDKIPEEFLSIYADRLIKSAINMRAKGEGKFARKIGALALGLQVGPRNIMGWFKRIVFAQGRWACWLWFKVSRFISGNIGSQ